MTFLVSFLIRSPYLNSYDDPTSSEFLNIQTEVNILHYVGKTIQFYLGRYFFITWLKDVLAEKKRVGWP